ncbi:MAG: hypothetical protein K2N90_07250 [Lachnospiraceae bacterium]|nr:hypothetical protein [Lachnospiraceae bacterium]
MRSFSLWKQQIKNGFERIFIEFAEYTNHPACIYIFDDIAGIFTPYTETIVAQSGNIGFYTRRLTDFVVMIAE